LDTALSFSKENTGVDIAESILFEDTQLLICHKMAGIAVQTKHFGEQDMESLLRNYLARKGEKPYVGIVHRLDQPVEGVMVFAKNPKAAAALNKQLQNNGFGKYYLAVLQGHLPEQSGTLTDYLRKDGRKNMSFVVAEKEPEAKKAVLHYELLEAQQQESLIKIKLETGRHHQIRVQMAHAGCPLAGDGKYASLLDESTIDKSTKDQSNTDTSQQLDGIALCSYRIEFNHPISGKKMKFQIEPTNTAFHKFANLKLLYK
jgi:23S rRNA pseudouridine1911/1915/1917 synthase